MTENELKVFTVLVDCGLVANDHLSPTDAELIAKQIVEIVESLSLTGVSDCIILEQEWFEDENSKSGWSSNGWNEPDGYEIDGITDTDKHGNPTRAVFKYCR